MWKTKCYVRQYKEGPRRTAVTPPLVLTGQWLVHTVVLIGRILFNRGLAVSCHDTKTDLWTRTRRSGPIQSCRPRRWGKRNAMFIYFLTINDGDFLEFFSDFGSCKSFPNPYCNCIITMLLILLPICYQRYCQCYNPLPLHLALFAQLAPVSSKLPTLRL